MMTVGGILYREDQNDTLKACRLKDLSFIKDGGDSCHINPPNLTFREIHHLDAQLPERDIKKIKTSSIPISDIERYMEIYRYYPTFSETEI